MLLYLIIFLIPLLMYWYSCKKQDPKNVTMLAVYLLGLAIFVGLGDMLGGYDRYIYGEVFDNIADTTNHKGSYLANGDFFYFPSETGYTILNIFLSFFTENRYIFIFTITLIIYSCLFISIKRYATNYPFALILFLGLWFFFSFTYLRQVLGATIMWLSLPYIIKRKFWKFLAIFIIACSLHKSAIIFFPVYFIVDKSLSKKHILRIMALCFIVGISPLPNALFTAYGDASEVEMREDYNASGELRFEYILESAFFLWLMLRDYRQGVRNKTQQVLFNIALLFCATLLFFIRSENGGRLGWYYMIGIICTITTIATNKFSRKDLDITLIAICFLLFFRIFYLWQPDLEPYKTFLTDSYRKNDRVWMQYEYDHHYDFDKMYRKPFRIRLNL